MCRNTFSFSRATHAVGSLRGWAYGDGLIPVHSRHTTQVRHSTDVPALERVLWGPCQERPATHDVALPLHDLVVSEGVRAPLSTARQEKRPRIIRNRVRGSDRMERGKMQGGEALDLWVGCRWTAMGKSLRDWGVGRQGGVAHLSWRHVSPKTA